MSETSAKTKDPSKFTGNRPILKWAGGKYAELGHISRFLPQKINTFIDPFVGGGSILYNVKAERYCINDIDRDLMWFYIMTWKGDLWKKVHAMCLTIDLARHYIRNVAFKKSLPSEAEFVSAGVHAAGMISSHLFDPDVIFDLEKEYLYRLKRIGALGVKNTDQFMRTGLHAVIYRMVRHAYNEEIAANRYTPKRVAAWFCMRDIAFGGMQRFTSNNLFSVPYGGSAYDSRDIKKRCDRFEKYRKGMTRRIFDVNCMDFEEFLPMALERYGDNRDNFIFLDPPYDTAFSSYSTKSDFNFDQYQALRNTMMSVNCRFMMVMKVTPGIKKLFMKTGAGWYYHFFDKKYRVNIRNRNDRSAQHVLIMNYRGGRDKKDGANLLERL